MKRLFAVLQLLALLLAPALAFAAEGAAVVICGRRAASLARVADDIRAAGGVVHAVTADVSQAEDVARLVEETVARFGALHILINNAGVDAAFFAGTDIKSNFLCNLGYGDASALRPRSPRFAFDEMARIA